VLVVLCAAELLVTLDGIIVTVALPTIQRALDIAQPDLQWVVTAYTLPFGAFLLVSGRAGDLYGRRRSLVTGLVVFTAASLFAGLASDFAHLIVARAAQGVGAALAIPATLALLASAYRRERERQRALGLLSMSLDLGMVIGLVLGGLLTATAGWPWCFFVVVPFGALAAILVPFALEESKDAKAPSLDIVGALLAAAGFGLLAFGVVRLEHIGLGALWPIAMGLILLGTFLLVERRVREPLVRLSIFRHRPLAGANVAIVANAGGFGGLMFLTTLYLQQRLGLSALQVGLAYLPLAASAAAGGLLAPRIVARVGTRWCAVVCLAVTALTFAWLTQASTIGGYVAVFLPSFLVAGFTFAAAYVPLTAQAMSGVESGERGLASGLFQTATHLGGALVLATLSTVAAAMSARATEFADSGFVTAFLLGAAILLGGALVAARTLPRTA
jgi:EmrB/QacA subfamily drug resistance transporter